MLAESWQSLGFHLDNSSVPQVASWCQVLGCYPKHLCSWDVINLVVMATSLVGFIRGWGNFIGGEINQWILAIMAVWTSMSGDAVCGSMPASRGASSHGAEAPTLCRHLPQRLRGSEGPSFFPIGHGSSLTPCCSPPALLATTGRLSMAFARDRARQAQLSRDLGSLSYPPCDWCSGRYNVA